MEKKKKSAIDKEHTSYHFGEEVRRILHWDHCVMLADADGFATMLSARKELAQLVDTVSITACMLDHWMLISGKKRLFLLSRAIITLIF